MQGSNFWWIEYDGWAVCLGPANGIYSELLG